MASMDKACYCFIWLILTCGTICLLTGAGTSYWLSNNNNDGHQGIFQKCEPASILASGCETSVIKFWQAKVPEAARLCLIASMGLLVLATLLSCISPCIEKDISLAYVLMDLGAFLTALAALVLYTVEYKDVADKSWGWSYILAWVGCSLHALGVTLLCWAGCVEAE
eukprot:TCONS_00010411-protein